MEKGWMKKNICFVVSSMTTVKAFLLDHVTAFSQMYDVSVIANTSDTGYFNAAGIEATLLPVCIERRIAPWYDLKALFRLVYLFRKHRFDVVHSVTPKAGMLATIAGRMAGVPVRVHTFTGQVWATSRGLKRLLLKMADRLLAFFATDILVDSFSQREFLIAEGVVSADKSRVLASGSISGVNPDRFRPNPESREMIRGKYRIPATDVVFLYVGRLKKDKGILDLANAFVRLSASRQSVWLMLVGPDEENLTPTIGRVCETCKDRVFFEGFVASPAQYMAAGDVLCLPSYREGFGSVVIEAAAVGIPAIVSGIYGLTEAVEAGVTGMLHEPADQSSLQRLMAQMADNAELRRQMGKAARERAVGKFSKSEVTRALCAYYRRLLGDELVGELTPGHGAAK